VTLSINRDYSTARMDIALHWERERKKCFYRGTPLSDRAYVRRNMNVPAKILDNTGTAILHSPLSCAPTEQEEYLVADIFPRA